jgi:hypothetical protein
VLLEQRGGGRGVALARCEAAHQPALAQEALELRRAPVVLAQRAVGAEDRLEARHVRLEHLAHLVEVKGG